ncbi:hypothetical protein [Leptonema illini]|uniref:PBS lyase HEAT domain protein repeat-containing protein n=1 Tax=Leptonema illini DSM 21528 TaxID=929563 RepID=H2CCD4_9LEPT|nr:hypothetical protein [Leptonema illini]EHQ06391.1 hypothetical protein Lepil_1707 [Leptonema illini DSM 21528]
MTRKTNILRLLCALTLVFSWSVLSADPGDSMVDESAQPAETTEAIDTATETQPEAQPQETQTTETKPASECSADLRSDSPQEQIRGAKCAAEKKDEKAVPDLIHVLKNQDQPSVLTEVLIALAVIGETGETTSALMEKAGDTSLKPADRYIVVATLVALRTDAQKAQIQSLLSDLEGSDASDALLKDLASKLKPLVGG